MGRLIDIDILFDYFGNDAIDEITRSNIEYFVSEKGTVEAIPKSDYENRLKADLKAILVELQLEIEECVDGTEGSPQFEQGVTTARIQVVEIIQQKINELEGKMKMSELIDKDEILKKAVMIPGPSGRSVFSVVFTDDILNAKSIDPTTKNNLGVDCVARQDVERFIEGFINEYTPEEELEFINLELDGLKHLPPATPIRPKGHWIDKQHLFGSCSAECSSCHKRSDGFVKDSGFSLEYKYYDFCPNCGAKMESEE